MSTHFHCKLKSNVETLVDMRIDTSGKVMWL